MKIDKYSKMRNGNYKVIFDDGNNMIVHEDLILKYDLLLKKEIDEETKEKIQQENNNYLVYDIAIKYISYKMRSKKEVYEKLEERGIDKELISSTIKKLEDQGYLNDDAYTKAFINDKINLSCDGPKKIRSELVKKGVSNKIIDQNFDVFTKAMESERIESIVKKYIKSNHNKSVNALKVNLNQKLITLGYDSSLVIANLNKMKFDDSSIREREYEKIRSKLSKKYSGNELEMRIKQKMYQKGFKM